MAMLTDAQKKQLKRVGHSLKPVVMVGAGGMSDGVIDEVGKALEVHELIKIRVRVGDRAKRDEIIKEIGESTNAFVVQRIGNMALLFRENENDPKVLLPE